MTRHIVSLPSKAKKFFWAISAAVLLTASAYQGTAQQAAPATASIVDVASTPNAIASVSRSVAAGKTLHVTLGHAIFINTKMRLRRVYVADPAIMTSATLTPNQIVVTAMAPGI